MSGSKGTEKPTPKRLRKARRDGQIARTPELATWASTLAALFAVELSIRTGTGRFRTLFEDMARVAGEPDVAAALGMLRRGMLAAAVTVAPIALITMTVGVLANLVQVGFHPSSALIKPKLERLNPMAGMKRLLSPATAWEAARAALKVSLLGLLVYRSVGDLVPRLAVGGLAVPSVIAVTAGAAMRLARNVVLVGLLLAAVDYVAQRRRIGKRLMMTKQEVREELRQAEGDQNLKGAIRSRQLAASRNRMIADIASADVVVVNPTHVAVALRYDPEHGAPRVVAKGAGAIAARIREEAERHRVPLVSDVPLARAIYRLCDLGAEIPPELFDAVARLLAFLFGLRTRGVAAGHHRPVVGFLTNASVAIPG